ncbi:uncharacterized protein TRIREDRAFT_107032 [Trichoderma reesei QM6a]|uniref:Predicted protein n=2 Tax=Hypocrea jecorina TaxID=51453 RepID=G0RI21_HYPJQ|nr:uncharacterized protein TRIREDRAFT_107032 [Trichoderma reesei QM6a]EGR49188.1 predicted protein [Trichoderma reesei QM6a]ETS02415.1 hypothetical protein M419DRAFT_77862 [Trichoderma reesei RUT C-30]
MPRKGYDVTGTAPGSAAYDAAARAKQRSAPGNRTPRAGTPADPSQPSGDDQETPRASRVGMFTGSAPVGPSMHSQMNALQGNISFSTQQRFPGEQLYQNPLNASSMQAAGQAAAPLMGAPYGHGSFLGAQSSIFPGAAAPAFTGQFVNVPERFRDATFGTVGSGAQQQLWSSNQFHALPASQHGAQSRPIAYPNHESLGHGQAAMGTAYHPAPTSANAGSFTSQAAQEDTEMTDAED